MPSIEMMRKVERDFGYDMDAQLFDTRMLPTFQAHHSGQGTRSPDWDAKFFMWCKDQVKRDKRETGKTIEDRKKSTREDRAK
jgi:hypothetical protein